MKKRLQLGLLFIGALALSLTLASAEGKCGNAQQEMMNKDGKCGDAKKGMKQTKEKRETHQKDMMKGDGKCSASTKPKPAPTKGKCGKGKRGE